MAGALLNTYTHTSNPNTYIFTHIIKAIKLKKEKIKYTITSVIFHNITNIIEKGIQLLKQKQNTFKEKQKLEKA